MLKQAQRPWRRDHYKVGKFSWHHAICHTQLHVFKYGSEIGHKCYCKRSTLSYVRMTEQFIEPERK